MRLLPALAILLAGSFAPAPQAPTAELTLSKGYDKGWGFGRGTSQIYAMSPDTACRNWRKLALFSGFSGGEKIVRVPAGSTLLFRAETLNITMSTTRRGTEAECRNRFSFAPIAGHRYAMKQIARVADACGVSVVDAATGAAPPDLAELPKVACTK